MENMRDCAKRIEHMHANNSVKVKLLKDLLLDCYNEMEAQDQNMHPEIQHDLAEGYRLAKDYLRRLEKT